ncbi:MAG: xanthine dehydrogenase family protein subunit M [Acidobacteria bacterium]|nr:xanthine dehydrogenase family protein subunit M [Acidobacteriota bacterium]MCI0721851.1 xanthine dehydrogenase family protein subunit M [Acidobacteriota bacterium]
MIAQNFEYSSPNTLQEALHLLSDGNAKPLAGGMSLIPLMKLRLATPEHLVDLGRVADLKTISEASGQIHIGAMATHYDLESSSLLRQRCPLLAEAARHIGDVQVRNMGTIGGSVSHADPAADYPASLLALQAKVRLVRAGGERTLSLEDFLVDTFTTAAEPGEIIREIIVPVEEPGTGVNYQKMVQPASGFAIVGVAARLRKANGKISLARVGVTGLAPRPFRATAVEARLEGSAGTDDDIRQAAALIANGVEANTDLHASSNYRKQMAQVYAGRALRAALAGT